MPWLPVAVSRWSLQNKGPQKMVHWHRHGRSSREVTARFGMFWGSKGCNMVQTDVQRCPGQAEDQVFTASSLFFWIDHGMMIPNFTCVLHWFHWGWWIQQNRDPNENVDELNYSDLNVGELCHNSGRSISHTMLVIYMSIRFPIPIYSPYIPHCCSWTIVPVVPHKAVAEVSKIGNL